jgi:hypothetical protein
MEIDDFFPPLGRRPSVTILFYYHAIVDAKLSSYHPVNCRLPNARHTLSWQTTNEQNKPLENEKPVSESSCLVIVRMA